MNNNQPRRLDEILEELRCCPESILYQLDQQRQRSCACPANCKILEALDSPIHRLLAKTWAKNG